MSENFRFRKNKWINAWLEIGEMILPVCFSSGAKMLNSLTRLS